MARQAGSSAKDGGGPSHRLPGPGHNGPTDDELRIYVNGMVALALKRDALRAEVNAYRKTWKARGIELGAMDRRIRRLDWSNEEIKTDWSTERRYAEVLGQPIGTQLELYGAEGTPDALKEQIAWRARGRSHGLAGKGDPTKPPEGCPPECVQPYGEGWTDGQGETQQAFLRAHPQPAKPN